jgi:hypothetical protein
MPRCDADSSCHFAWQNIAERPLSEMPKYFYDSAETDFWGAGFAGAGYSGTNCRSTSETIRLETICFGIAGIEIVGIEITWDFAERENKIACASVRSCSPT